MACRSHYERTATNTLLVLLVLFEAVLVLDRANAVPVQQRNDILAGREFLSVFINGAMAPVPVAPPKAPRRRGFGRGGGSQSTADNVSAESRHSEASIYRISRAPTSSRPIFTRSGNREEGARLDPNINEKSMKSRDSPRTVSEEIGSTGELVTSVKHGQQAHRAQRVHQHHQKWNNTESSESVAILKNRSTHRNVNQKVIGVSVTSTVEATPYKVRVEHHDADGKIKALTYRPPVAESTAAESIATSMGTTVPSTIKSSIATTLLITSTMRSNTMSTTSTRSTATTFTTTVTPLPAQLVTEELSNIVSESNRSEFSVDESLPKTNWRYRSASVTTGSIVGGSSTPSSSSVASSSFFSPSHEEDKVRDSARREETSTSLEPVEESHEDPQENSEPREIHKEPSEMPEHVHQGRKAARHYDATIYNQPAKVYPHEESEPFYEKSSRAYGEIMKNSYSQESKMNYGEPARIYSEPAKIYSEPSKMYGEPSKIYGEPAKVYSEPARIYGEPAKIYSDPAKIYSKPSNIYGPDGRAVLHGTHREEPEEQNYEVDEAVSVGSNGNVHGPQVVTEATKRAPSTTSASQPPGLSSPDPTDGQKVGYVVDERNYRKYRVEERTPDGFIVGEYGVVSHDDGSLRGVRYTADGTIDPRLIYDALMKFLAL